MAQGRIGAVVMKRRNKKYNPNKHHRYADTVFRTIRLSKPIQEDSKDMLNKQIHAALLAITKGAGEPCHFDVMASTVDVVFMMGMNLFNNAYEAEIGAARQAMFELKDNFHKFGKFAFTGQGYQSIKELIAIHDEMLNQVTGAEMLAFMNARANAINNGNFYKSSHEKIAA